MTDIINIPLYKLTAWEGNVRKTHRKDFIEQLAASIKAHGLQQNLVVRKNGKKFAVVAGGQRLKAFRQLVEAGDIKASHLVPCRIIEDDTDASELSLAENVMRDNMHPADQFEAFRDLIDKGAPVADVAARFGVTETVVTQRLKLARVSPAILKAYRAGRLNLEQVMAFAISDDHEAQEQVLDNLRHDSHPRTIRDALTENDIAATDRRIKFVTRKAYEKAGGTTRRDLFSEDDSGVFILDSALLERLIAEKLERSAKALGKEGWKWTEVRPDFGYDDRAQYGRRHAEPVPLSAQEQARLEKLEQEQDALLDKWHNDDDDAERPERLDELQKFINEVNDREEIWPSETLAIAGAVVTIGYDGKTSIERGLIRPEDMPKKTGNAKAAGPSATGAGGKGSDQSTPFSAALIETLTAQRSAALSAEFLQRPDLALVALAHALASKILLGDQSTDNSLTIVASPQSFRNVKDSKALAHIESARENWSHRIPGTARDLWEWCLQQDQSVLLDLLAFCIATTINAVRSKSERPDSERLQHADMLASALVLDMKAWFTPTAENFFSRISKPQILAVIREAKGTPPGPAWEKLGKADLAAVAERETFGTGWLPEILRLPS